MCRHNNRRYRAQASSKASELIEARAIELRTGHSLGSGSISFQTQPLAVGAAAGAAATDCWGPLGYLTVSTLLFTSQLSCVKSIRRGGSTQAYLPVDSCSMHDSIEFGELRPPRPSRPGVRVYRAAIKYGAGCTLCSRQPRPEPTTD